MFADDILLACKTLIEKSKETVAYAGRLQNVGSNGIASVVLDGATGETPCTILDHVNRVSGTRVAVLKVKDTFYIIGTLGNRVLSLPTYTGAHPAGTNPGDSWYRTDLNHAYMNVNGTITQWL